MLPSRLTGYRRNPMTQQQLRSLAVVAVCVLLVAACASGVRVETSAGAQSHRAQVRGLVVVAAGDIACAPGKVVTASSCQQAATARLAATLHPRYVLTLGDQQYEDGALGAYQGSYAQAWGRFNRISRPVPGNHDYHQGGAAGYFAYFQRVTSPPGYYAFNVGRWRIYALNSNCSDVDCGAEAAWLN